MEQRHLQHLAGQFTGRGQLAERAAGGLIEFGDGAFDRSSLLFLRFEHITDQRIGFDFRSRPLV